jgi:hypothetical protein
VILDEILPQYQFHEIHSLAAEAPGATLFAKLAAITPAELPLLRFLMSVRAVPARAFSRPPSLSATEPLLQQFMRAGFLVLGEEPDRELVVGTVGQPWRLGAGSMAVSVRTVEDFVAFRRPGFVKIATNFRVDDERANRGGSRFSTETRVSVPDRATHLRFALYWILIRPGSGLIRREWLRVIRQRSGT